LSAGKATTPGALNLALQGLLGLLEGNELADLGMHAQHETDLGVGEILFDRANVEADDVLAKHFQSLFGLFVVAAPAVGVGDHDGIELALAGIGNEPVHLLALPAARPVFLPAVPLGNGAAQLLNITLVGFALRVEGLALLLLAFSADADKNGEAQTIQ
jgi:hypothetical protein